MDVLTQSIEFAPERDDEVFGSVPAGPAVFMLRGKDDSAEPYVSKTANLRRRLQRLLAAPVERSRRLNLREIARRIDYTPTGSDFESGFLLYRLLREYFPKTYSQRLRLSFAPLIKLHLGNPYPRASVTTRMGRVGGESKYYGPFPSRTTAEQFANDSLDFFKMRRCVDDLHPDPAFPGCIYSEMKMCLAPCFKGCSDEQYHVEVGKVRAYFESGGDTLAREMAGARDEASKELNFESAAALHVRAEKVRALIARLPEIARPIERLSGVIVQPSADAGCVAFFAVEAGNIAGPVQFAIQSAEHTKSQSMESRVREVLARKVTEPPRSSAETMEHLAVLKRWYFRSKRVGEIFLCDDDGNLPMRRMVRGISRVFQGEPAEEGEITSSPVQPTEH